MAAGFRSEFGSAGAAASGVSAGGMETVWAADGAAATPRRLPALAAALAVMGGVFLDERVRPEWSNWLLLSAAAALGGIAAAGVGWRRTGVVLLLAQVGSLAGAWHHACQFAARPNDISLYAGDEGRLVRLEGVLAEEPWVRAAEKSGASTPWAQFDQTICVLNCERLGDARQSAAVSGKVRGAITGHVLQAHVGDRVSVIGWLSRPQPPDNPGEFDMREYLERQGIRTVLYANHPAALQVVQPGERGDVVRRKLAEWRRLGEYRIAEHLSRETAPIAAALLLGVRSGISDDVRTAFIESGTMHLLAISGLHVGILAAFVLLIARCLQVAPGTRFALLMSAVLFYLLMTDGRPPIVRATVLIAVAAAGMLRYRPVSTFNALAVAALVVLAFNPAALFDVGAQLSFLAVVGIIWSQAWRRRSEARRRSDPLANLPGLRSWWSAAWLWFWEKMRESIRLMFGIWLFTLPLVLANFHVFSPAGLAANLLLMPWVFVVMGCGFCFLFCAFLLPQAAFLPAMLFDWGLRGLLWMVDAAAKVWLGHWYVPAPAPWWLVGYYAILAAFLAADRHSFWRRRCAWSLALWSVLGLAGGLRDASPAELRVTFLDVGHGCSVLMEFPNGATLLYDAGSLQNSKRAERAVQAALWERGRVSLDAVLVSHADIDHFNAVPELMRTIAVGKLLLSQPCLDFDQEGVVLLCERARRRGVPIELLQAADRIAVDAQTQLEVLHPHPRQVDPNDNANSVVLQVRFANRTLLLTGDLEGSGLSALLEREPGPIDILLSPHHGSVRANPAALAGWARPKFIVVSGGDGKSLAALRGIYRPFGEVLSTYESGAITFRISPDGTIAVEEFRERRSPTT